MKNHKCDICGKTKPDVKYVADPYDDDLLEETNMMWLCDDCYQDRIAAI